ncbi:MAG: hypothetical protein OSA48_12165 [Akkermansiaceae bacterium]|nr:hypothetical protein [Akkermansiaceae bacterium]
MSGCFKGVAGAVLLLVPGGELLAEHPNAVILEVVREMPKGGGYSVENKAKRSLDALQRSVQPVEGRIVVDAERATPSFCSSGTYVVLLKTLDRIQRKERFQVSGKVAERLRITEEQPDGEGVWGRWNANGPGAAKLLHDTKMGRSFEDWGEARAGDFMKIFWTEEIGQKEFGHLVVYLGTRKKGGKEWVRFWSSNKPGGYGEKEVEREKIKWAVFSRLERPERVSAVVKLGKTDKFLASMLTKRFTREEVRRALGMR